MVNNSNGILGIFPKKEENVIDLYDYFYPRDIDEQAYDNRMKFWQGAIKAYCEDKGLATFSILELQDYFTHKDNKPKCLPTVIQYLVQTNEIRELESFQLNPLNTWFVEPKSSLFKNLLILGWNKLKTKIYLKNQKEALTVQYVQLNVLKSFCELLVKKVLNNLKGKIHFYKDIRTWTEFSLPRMNESCLKLCLYTLCHHSIIGISHPQVLNLQNSHLIKIPKDEDSAEFTSSDIESSLVELETIKTCLQNLLKRYEADINANENCILNLVRIEDNDFAKYLIEKEKTLEHSADLLRDRLNNLESTVNPTEMTDDSGVNGSEETAF